MNQDEIDEEHIKNPKVGDYWNEMLVPALVVVKVRGNSITVCKTKKSTDADHWTWDLEKLEVMTKQKMKKYLSYGSIKGYWARVQPEAHKWVSKEPETKKCCPTCGRAM